MMYQINILIRHWKELGTLHIERWNIVRKLLITAKAMEINLYVDGVTIQFT